MNVWAALLRSPGGAGAVMALATRLGALLRGVTTYSGRGVRMLRLSVAFGSIGFGSYLVHSAF